MNPETQLDLDGAWHAVFNEDVCTHKHAAEKNAMDCFRWEERSFAKTGKSAWHAPRGGLKFDRLIPVAVDGERATDEDVRHSHEYVPMPDLAALWHAVVTGAQTRPAANILFIGPSGSGKTDGARYLAGLAGLPITKVDAASMTDPEAWFGTREIVVRDGVAVTHYEPSAFVESVQRPGVTFIDEVNRVRDEIRGVLLPILDATRCVMNPLTGQVVTRHPQNFIIMAGNVGIHFTGTSAIDPAFLTRSLTVEFAYIDEANEQRIVKDASGCTDEDAQVFVRFANETRAKAKSDPDFLPISTREAIEAGRLVADGLSRDLAVKFVVLNAASGEGGSASIRQELENIWAGVRVVKQAKADPTFTSSWVCPVHGKSKVIPAGISKTGKPYKAFRACDVFGCSYTEDRNPGHGINGVALCTVCNTPQPVGRSAICVSCGAALP